MEKIVILSRFNEQDDRFYKKIKSFYSDNINVYDKGDRLNKDSILLPNVGREGHTYLDYIINNYNKLPNEILFSQYNPYDHFKKMERLRHFILSSFTSYCSINSTDYDDFVRSSYFNWSMLFEDIYQYTDIKYNNVDRLMLSANINGVFKVKKQAILKHPLEFYKYCQSKLSDEIDPYWGYFFERAWKYIFFDVGYDSSLGMIVRLTPKKQHIISVDYNHRSGDRPFLKIWKSDSLGEIFLHSSGTILASHCNINFFTDHNLVYWKYDLNTKTLYLLDHIGAISYQFTLDIENKEKISTGDCYVHTSMKEKKVYNKSYTLQIIEFIHS